MFPRTLRVPHVTEQFFRSGGSALLAHQRSLDVTSVTSVSCSRRRPKVLRICVFTLFLGFTDWDSRIGRNGSEILCWFNAFEKTDFFIGI